MTMRRLGFAMGILMGLACVFLLGGCPGPTTQVLLQPAHVDPNVVMLAGELDNKLVRALAPGELLARLRIDTRPLKRLFHPRINLALVIDTSGSMEGDAIRDAKKAAAALVDKLSKGDRLAIVTFNSRTQVLVPSQPLSDGNRAAILARIQSIGARSTTDLAGGLQAGFREVSRYYDKSGINRVVLISDGVPNDAAPILPLAAAMGKAGVAVTSLGLGIDFDEALMGEIAQRSGGRYHLVEKSTEVAQVFEDEVLRLRRVVGRNLQLQLAAGPGVQIKEIVGHGAVSAVPLGELGEDETRDVIVRLSVPGRRSGAAIELFDALLSFDDAIDNAGHFQRQLFLAAHATDDEAARAASRNPEVEHDAEKARQAARLVADIAAGNPPLQSPLELRRMHDRAMHDLQPTSRTQ
jgi:Ca-activated chloride channel family protein